MDFKTNQFDTNFFQDEFTLKYNVIHVIQRKFVQENY